MLLAVETLIAARQQVTPARSTLSQGMRAAAIQSLLATAKLNGIEPTVWLKSTLEKLPTCLNSRIDELLPIKH